MLEFISIQHEARLMKRFVIQHSGGEFVLESIWYPDVEKYVKILHYAHYNRPACERQFGERYGSMARDPNRQTRNESTLCRRCRELNRR